MKAHISSPASSTKVCVLPAANSEQGRAKVCCILSIKGMVRGMRHSGFKTFGIPEFSIMQASGQAESL